MTKEKLEQRGSIRLVSLLLIFISIFGFAAVTLADDPAPLVPNKFYGDVFFNGNPAPDGSVIGAYIDGVLHSGTVTGDDYDVFGGEYYIFVTGDTSNDGSSITFKVNGITADHDPATWTASTLLVSQELDLTVQWICGDVNGDGIVDANDVGYLANHVIENPGYEILYGDGNVNGDTTIDANDVGYLANHVIENPGYENLYCNN